VTGLDDARLRPAPSRENRLRRWVLGLSPVVNVGDLADTSKVFIHHAYPLVEGATFYSTQNQEEMLLLEMSGSQ
jgi:hypothetical protein